MGSSCSFLVLVSYTRALRTAVSLMSDPVDDSSVEPVKTKPDSSNQAKETKSKKPKNKCAVCKKKLGLTGFECRCGNCSVASIATLTSTNVRSITKKAAEQNSQQQIPSLLARKSKNCRNRLESQP